MKVFILVGIWERDGEKILGVYNNIKLAEDQKEKFKKLEYTNFDDYSIEEWEVLNEKKKN